MVKQNPRTTVRGIAEELDAAKTTVHRRLQAIGKVKKLEQWVPHELTDMNRKNSMIIAHSLLNGQRNEDFLDRLITCDEKWILYDNRRRSAQWLDKDEPAKHTPKPALHFRKTMVTVWWTAREVIQYGFLPTGQAITSESYCAELEIVHQKLLKICPISATRNLPVLLHDNARPHVALKTL